MRKHIVCLGGGIGTVNLIKGLRSYEVDLSVVVSMADDGGSAGRLRRLYNIQPSGDIVSCTAAICEEENEMLSRMLTYRFPGDRYASDNDLAGQKLGNLIMVALRDITGNFYDALALYKKIFNLKGTLLPATEEIVSLKAKTDKGEIISSEEVIDLGKYEGAIEQIFLEPENPPVGREVLDALAKADAIIAGPGDLYTNILPILIVPGIAEALYESKAKKIFIVNVANKPFETKGYSVSDFMSAVKKHIRSYPFSTTIVNSNTTVRIPEQYDYHYVPIDAKAHEESTIIEKDLVSTDFPLYHDSQKLARTVMEQV